MNNEEKQNTDERFTLVELANGDFAVCDAEAPEKMNEVCIFGPFHPYAKAAAEAERDRLNAWNREGGTIRPLDVKQHGENIPESEEPEQLRKPTSEGKPFYFNVLLPDGKNAKLRMEHFEAKDGQFFVIYKSPLNGGLSFRAATLEDYKELGNLMPSEEALRAQFENARAEFERRCLPRKHKKEKGFSGKMIDVETPAKRIAEKVRMAYICDFEDYNDMHRYYEAIRELAQEGMDEEADKWHYRNAKYKAERVFSCYAECKVRDLPERKRKTICKKCRRNPEFEDNFTDGKEEK